MFLCNAFSLQMLEEFPATVTFEEVAKLPENLESAVGHQDTANVLGDPIDLPVCVNRQKECENTLFLIFFKIIYHLLN